MNRIDPLGLHSSDIGDKLEQLAEAIELIKEFRDTVDRYNEYGEIAALVIESFNGNLEAQADLAQKGLDRAIGSLAAHIGLPAGSAAVIKEGLELGNTLGVWIGDQMLGIDCAGACNSCSITDSRERGQYQTTHIRSGREVECLESNDCKVYAKCLVRTGGGSFLRGIIDRFRGRYFTWRWVLCEGG